MKFKKVICYALMSGMIISQASFPYQSNVIVIAASNKKEDNSEKENLKKVLSVVKSKVAIPEECTEFSYDFVSDQYEGDYFRFYWRTKDIEGDSVCIESDLNGNVLSYDYYDDKEETTEYFMEKDLKSKAEATLKKMYPNEYSLLKLSSILTNSLREEQKKFIYTRYHNGVIVPADYIQIDVSCYTGNVTFVSLKWDFDVTFPDNKACIQKEDAIKTIEKNLEMKLVYEKVYQDEKVKYKLMYLPSNNYLSVDSSTGKVYKESPEESMERTGDYVNYNLGDSCDKFTKSETVEIEKMSNLLSKKDAINLLRKNKNLNYPKISYDIRANLYKNTYNEKDQYIWEIRMNGNSKDTMDTYLYADIDAESKEIIRFNTSLKSIPKKSYDQTLKKIKSDKTGVSIAKKYIEKYYPKFAGEYELEEIVDDYPMYSTKKECTYFGKQYVFRRTKNGIPTMQDKIYVSVDLITGKIYNFRYNWDWDIDFESTKNVISAEEAKKSYLMEENYQLIYEKKKRTSKKARMVYISSTWASYIDAISGKILDQNGDEVQEKVEFKYTDIVGHKYEKDINIMSEFLIGYKGDKFNPDAPITKEEFEQLLFCPFSGKIIEEPTKKEYITREEVAKYIIDKKGLSRIAAFDIYKCDFADEKDITKGYLGYLVLASKVGILDLRENNKIAPKEYLTRAEAMHIIVGEYYYRKFNLTTLED